MPTKVKNTAIKMGKALGYAATTLALVATGLVYPVLLVPTMIGAVYTCQKVLTNTIFKSYNDLAFISMKIGNKIKIAQDVSRMDLISKTLKLNKVQKLGFLQMQLLVGLSKFDGNKNGPVTFETNSHSVIRKTLKSLAELGYIESYQEKYKRNAHLFAPKLSFGNYHELNKTEEYYNIQFRKTDKKIDFNDEKLRMAFPAIFSKKRGLLTSSNYNVIVSPDGSLQIKYNDIDKTIKESKKIESKFHKTIRKGAPTMEAQSEFSKNYVLNKDESGNKVEMTSNNMEVSK